MTDYKQLMIAGSGGGKGGGSASEDPNSIQSNSIARLIDVLCEGEIGGLVNGARSVFLDGVPLQNEDESYNFEGVEWSFRSGLPDQEPHEGFSEVEAETQVSQEIKKEIPVTFRITDSDIDDVRVKIQLPSLYEVDDEGNIIATSVQFTISVKGSNTSYQQVVDATLNEKTNASYERAYRITNISQYGDPPLDFKVERVTADSEDLKLQNKTYLSSYTTIINQKLVMPGVASIALKVDAQQFGSHIPTRSYLIDGYNQCRVPSNYDPVARTYSDFWDGRFQYAWTDNPAWVLMELITNERFGIPGFDTNESEDHLAGPAYLNKWRLYEIAKYCDGQVKTGYYDSEGNPTYEPRFTCNIYLQTQEEAFHVINALASAFTTMPYWSSAMLDFAQDQPTSASHLATPANVINGEFHYSGTSLKSRPSVVLVTWNDPNDSYKQSIEVVEDPELILKFGWRKQDVVSVGCTSRGQAIRMGRWILRSTKMETETVSFKGGFEFADCVPGSIIKVQDPHYAQVRFGGRIKSGTAGQVVLDAPVTLETGQTYTLSVSLPDKSLEEVDVLTGACTTDTLAVAPFSQAPEPFAVWVLSASNLNPRPFRVLANVEAAPNEFEITASFHDVTKYAWVDEGVDIEPPPYNPPWGTIDPPTNLTVDVFSYVEGSNFLWGALLSWTPSTDPRVMYYEAQIQAPAEGWKAIGETTSSSVEKKPINEGIYNFRVRACGVGYSPWVTLENVSIGDPTDDVPNVQNLRLVGGVNTSGNIWEFGGRDAEAVWDTVKGLPGFPEARFAYYAVAIFDTDTGTMVRNEAVTDERYIYTYEKNQYDFGTPKRTFEIAVVAIDTFYKQSPNPAVIVAINPAPSMAGYTPKLDPMWIGIEVQWHDLDVPDIDLTKFAIYYKESTAEAYTLSGYAQADAHSYFIPIPVDFPEGDTSVITYDVYVVPYDAFGAGTGSELATGVVDPSDLIDLLDKSFQEGQLYRDLLAKIETPSEVLDSDILLSMFNGEWPAPYNAATAYNTSGTRYYCVYNGKVYRCTQACTGIAPSDPAYWREASSTVQTYYELGEAGQATDARVDVLEGEIVLKASALSVTELAARVTTAEVDIDGLQASIVLKANSADVTALTSRVSAAEIEIDGLQGQIILKAAQSSLDATNNLLYSVQSEMALKPNEWTLKVDANGNIAGMGLIAYPVWSANVSYTHPSFVLYGSTVYKTKSSPPKGTLPTNTTYWQSTTASSSQVIFLTSSFGVYDPYNPASPKFMFGVGTVNGVTTVGIKGDLIVDGSISATKIKTQELVIPWTSVSGSPSLLGTVSAPGLYANGTNIGFYSGVNWPIRIYLEGGTGKFYFGNAQQTKYVSWNGSALTVNGDLYVSGTDGVATKITTSFPGNVYSGAFNWTQIASLYVSPAAASRLILIGSAWTNGSVANLRIRKSTDSGGMCGASGGDMYRITDGNGVSVSCSTVIPSSGSGTYYLEVCGGSSNGSTFSGITSAFIRFCIMEVKA